VPGADLVVEVEGGVCALAKCGLHGQVIDVGRPDVVCGMGDAKEAVGNGCVDVGVREVGELRGDHGVGNVVWGGGVGGGSVGNNVHIGIDGIEEGFLTFSVI
jgi:hypothetical protein